MKNNNESLQDLILGLQFVGAACFLGAAVLGVSSIYSGHAASAREKVNSRPPGSVIHVYQTSSAGNSKHCIKDVEEAGNPSECQE